MDLIFPAESMLIADIPVLAVVVALVPLLASAAALTRAGRHLGWLGTIAVLPALWLGLALTPESTDELTIDWLLLGARVGADVHTADFLLLTGVLWLAASVAGQAYFDAQSRRRIAPWWMLALAGNVALPVALDPITYFACFALMSLASYGLVVHRGDADALRAARIYVIYVIAGEVTLFCALALGGNHALAAPLLLIGYGIKVGVLGLHSWLPLAHGVAPAPASAVLSATMLKAGLLGWLRFHDPLVQIGPMLATVLAGLGLAGAFAGVLLGLPQRSPKTILAYSSVSQMGLLTLAFGLVHLQPGAAAAGGAAAALGLLAMHHAFAKGALFLGVALVERVAGRLRLAAFGLLALPALALVGLPWSSGAVAKSALGALAVDAGHPWAGVLVWALPVAACGTALLLVRFMLALPAGDGRPVRAALWLPCAVLAGLGFALGAAAQTASVTPGDWVFVGAAVAGAALIVLAWSRWHLPAAGVPAGDLVVGFEALWRSGVRCAPTRGWPALVAWRKALRNALATRGADAARGGALADDLLGSATGVVSAALVTLVLLSASVLAAH